ncbi:MULTISPECIES: hypothetical protein [Burkholderia cepacia complex]|uniref:hypothetical protein n=1 Tax=Burkholderia cepacia complex TaxID=87882 RepID=UPI0023DD7E31|nr:MULTISPECIES: hypothetical protein [Burkholderia cepacia complex]MDF3091838.1 hypothetical protein [Burkholderia semiarida]MDF3107349.1 hypothetical protein [Burkholderia semiarida]WJN78154.1 hypothetical protein OH687_15095 [Burkholderia anthina]
MARFVVDNALCADDIDARRAGIRRRDLSPTMTEAASRTALLREWGNCRFVCRAEVRQVVPVFPLAWERVSIAVWREASDRKPRPRLRS